jgi:poly-gamma-glutamate capsule biosynthesis protein CapA/YwtB (metallophosphatase superfamily)
VRARAFLSLLAALAAIGALAYFGAPEESAAPASTATSTAKADAPASVEIYAVGDIMPSRWVELRLREHGMGYAFASTSEILRAGQITFGNLESPLVPGELVPAKAMVFRGDPDFANALADAGFDVVSLANNHTADQGELGILATRLTLRDAGVRGVGTGTTTVAHSPVVIETPTGSAAFLAYADARWVPQSYLSTDDRRGVAPMDAIAMAADVGAAGERADFVVVSMHAGVEYEPLPDDVQRAFAEAAVAAGADLVIGHHPHVLQPIEEIDGVTVAWSLGNFVFDQDGAGTRDGAVARFRLAEGEPTEVAALPVQIVDYAQPRPVLVASAAKPIAARLFDRPTPCPEGEVAWWCEAK